MRFNRVILLALALALIACMATPPPEALTYSAIARDNATQTAQALLTASPVPSPTATPDRAPATVVPSLTPAPTPTREMTSSIVEVTPCGQYICETTDNQRDIDILARLCVVEVRGFAEAKDDACVSVVSTVVTRMLSGTYSDGSVRGTITWGCTPEDGCLQFPGFVVNGCQGIIPQACPWNYPDEIAHFRDVVDHYLRGRWGPGFWCSGYLYYDSRPDISADACVIRASNGQFEAFHN